MEMRKFSAHLGYLFSEMPLDARFEAAKRVGFSGVEHPSPYSAPAADVARWLASIELPFVQMALPAGDASRGEKGLAALPDRVEEFGATIALGIDYALEIGCPALHVMAGVRPDGTPHRQLWDTYVDNMSRAAEAAARDGLKILIEPIGAGTLPDYFIDRAQLALEAIRDIGRDNVRLLFDVFHCVNGGDDPIAFIEANATLLYHVHIADHPGRHEPGSGRIDFTAVYAALDRAGYSGFIGCEYVPAGRTEDGLCWLAEHASP